MEIKSSLKNIGVGVVKNGCGHSGLRTIKLAVSQKGINEINWFLVRGHFKAERAFMILK